MSFQIASVGGSTSPLGVFQISSVGGSASTGASFDIAYVGGDQNNSGAAGVFQIAYVGGTSQDASTDNNQSVTPFEAVTLPPGSWSQVAGPAVILSGGNSFIAPATSTGVTLQFNLSTGQTALITVAAHTLFAYSAGQQLPMYTSLIPTPIPGA
jgi:hypothetical protein